MRRTRRYVEVEIHRFLVGLEDQVAVGANRDPQVKEDKAVDVSVACPAQGPPLVEAVEECVPGKVAVGLREPDSDAVIYELFEEWKAGLKAGNQALYFKEADVEVSVVYGGAYAHGTAPCLLPKSVAELEDVAAHEFRQGFDDEVHWHAFR